MRVCLRAPAGPCNLDQAALLTLLMPGALVRLEAGSMDVARHARMHKSTRRVPASTSQPRSLPSITLCACFSETLCVSVAGTTRKDEVEEHWCLAHAKAGWPRSCRGVWPAGMCLILCVKKRLTTL